MQIAETVDVKLPGSSVAARKQRGARAVVRWRKSFAMHEISRRRQNLPRAIRPGLPIPSIPYGTKLFVKEPRLRKVVCSLVKDLPARRTQQQIDLRNRLIAMREILAAHGVPGHVRMEAPQPALLVRAHPLNRLIPSYSNAHERVPMSNRPLRRRQTDYRRNRPKAAHVLVLRIARGRREIELSPRSQ